MKQSHISYNVATRLTQFKMGAFCAQNTRQTQLNKNVLDVFAPATYYGMRAMTERNAEMKPYEALNQQLYTKLREMVLTNQFEFDTIYSETRLAASLSVSRTPIRDALVRLSQEHYIDIIPSRGFMLHQPTKDDLCSARHFRMAIETYCARQLTSGTTKDEREAVVGRMADLLDEQRACADPSFFKVFWQLDVQFHKQMITLLETPFFDALYANAHYTFTSLSVENFFRDGRHLSTLDEHAAIVSALADQNTDLAVSAIAFHIEESTSALIANMQRKDGRKQSLPKRDALVGTPHHSVLSAKRKRVRTGDAQK